MIFLAYQVSCCLHSSINWKLIASSRFLVLLLRIARFIWILNLLILSHFWDNLTDNFTENFSISVYKGTSEFDERILQFIFIFGTNLCSTDHYHLTDALHALHFPPLTLMNSNIRGIHRSSPKYQIYIGLSISAGWSQLASLTCWILGCGFG